MKDKFKREADKHDLGMHKSIELAKRDKTFSFDSIISGECDYSF